MYSIRQLRYKHLAQAIVLIAALTVSVSQSRVAQAAIQLPDQISFSADELERTFLENAAGGAGSSSSRHSDSPQGPTENTNPSTERFGLLQGQVPSGGASSNGSTSSTSSGGSTSAGAIGNPLTRTIAVRDDEPLGLLTEEQGLWLPDPPGTDLLRPPRF
jgi:hypothetical protein